MSEHPFAASVAVPRERGISVAALLGQVLFLVALAIGFLTFGAIAGKDLSGGTALLCWGASFVMLLVQSFGGERFRVGPFAMGWLFGLSFLLGLGLAPGLAAYASQEPEVVVQAAGTTALVLAGCGAGGMALSKDLSGWMRPLSFVVFGLIAVSFVMLLLNVDSPLLSLAIAGVSALLIVVDFNFLRKHGTERDAIWLATGIFVSIVNIFLSLLNLFSD
jgi:FtsH-binding integral membrane protein